MSFFNYLHIICTILLRLLMYPTTCRSWEWFVLSILTKEGQCVLKMERKIHTVFAVCVSVCVCICVRVCVPVCVQVCVCVCVCVHMHILPSYNSSHNRSTLKGFSMNKDTYINCLIFTQDHLQLFTPCIFNAMSEHTTFSNIFMFVCFLNS